MFSKLFFKSKTVKIEKESKLFKRLLDQFEISHLKEFSTKILGVVPPEELVLFSSFTKKPDRNTFIDFITQHYKNEQIKFSQIKNFALDQKIVDSSFFEDKTPKKFEQEIVQEEGRKLVQAISEEKKLLEESIKSKSEEKIKSVYKMPKKTQEIIDSINSEEQTVNFEKFSLEELYETYFWVQFCSKKLIKEGRIPFEAQNNILIPIYNGIMKKCKVLKKPEKIN